MGGSVFGQIKLIISFVQILGSMPVAFDSVPWPSNFKNFYFGLLGWVNLDFLSILVSPNTCNLSLSPLDRNGATAGPCSAQALGPGGRGRGARGSGFRRPGVRGRGFRGRGF